MFLIVGSIGTDVADAVWPFASTSSKKEPSCDSSPPLARGLECEAWIRSDSSTERSKALRVAIKDATQARTTASAATPTVAAMTRDRKVTRREARNRRHELFVSVVIRRPLRACVAGSQCRPRANWFPSQSCNPTPDRESGHASALGAGGAGRVRADRIRSWSVRSHARPDEPLASGG